MHQYLTTVKITLVPVDGCVWWAGKAQYGVMDIWACFFPKSPSLAKLKFLFPNS